MRYSNHACAFTGISPSAVAIIVLSSIAAANAQSKNTSLQPQHLVNIFNNVCMDVPELTKIEALAKRYKWVKLGRRITDAYRPDAKRVDYVHAWQFRVKGVAYRLYLTSSSLAKAMQVQPELKNFKHRKCRLSTPNVTSHKEVINLFTKGLKRKPEHDFSVAGKQQLHQWNALLENEGYMFNIITRPKIPSTELIFHKFTKSKAGQSR